MSDNLIKFPTEEPPQVVDVKVQVISCSCGNNRLMLVVPCEVYCPECMSVIDGMHWGELAPDQRRPG